MMIRFVIRAHRPVLAAERSTNRNVWPAVEFPDMCMHLLNFPSPYIKEALKAFKSTEGYACFVAGEMLIIKLSDNTLLTAKVM